MNTSFRVATSHPTCCIPALRLCPPAQVDDDGRLVFCDPAMAFKIDLLKQAAQ